MSSGAINAALLSCPVVLSCAVLCRGYLFLGGYLSSAISAMLMMRLGSWIFGYGRFMFDVELYLGLLVFSGYVLFDTQLVVERASAGDMDNVQHALNLFTNLIAIFVRVLVILMKNQEKKERRRKRDD